MPQTDVFGVHIRICAVGIKGIGFRYRIRRIIVYKHLRKIAVTRTHQSRIERKHYSETQNAIVFVYGKIQRRAGHPCPVGRKNSVIVGKFISFSAPIQFIAAYDDVVTARRAVISAVIS